MHQISGYLQNYAWGVPGGLAAWRPQGDDTAQPKPEAELWYGAHPNGPSALVDAHGTLSDVAAADQTPILVKLLAAAKPLSIQIHPTAEAAARDFAAQQADPSLPQLLADGLAKTEMLIALRPFSVLQGLRSPALAAAILRNVSADLAEVADLVVAGDPKAAIRRLLEFRPSNINELTDLVPSAAAAAGLGASGVEALAAVACNYPGDPGVLVAALMDHRVLSEGEAVYVPAGVVHAYINGTGIEVMTSSDNVLRLGLTPKTIAVDEALNVLDPSAHPVPMSGDPVDLPNDGSHLHYAPAGAPFVVDWIRRGSFTSPSGDYRLVLAVSHHVKVAVDGVEVDLAQGQAVAIMPNEGDAQLVTSGSVVVARPNQHAN